MVDDGKLPSADRENDRVLARDGEGERLRAFGERGTELGEFWLAADVAVDEAGRLFVTDFDDGRVQAFSGPGELLGKWLIPPDDRSLPTAMTSAGDGRLKVNDPVGDRIHVLRFVGG